MMAGAHTGNQQEEVPLRIGIAGLGRIVERIHLPVLVSRPDVRIAGLFDTDEERADAVARLFGQGPVCTSIDDLCRQDLDIVLVACPNSLHAALSIAALDAGLHVLCEKPMATNIADAELMRATARRQQRRLMIALPNRFRPEVRALQQAIAEGRLGAIRSMRCGWLRRAGVPGAGTWFTDRRQAGGGVLTDLGTHLLDLALWLTERPELLTALCVVERSDAANTEASWYRPTAAAPTAEQDVETGARGFAIFAGPFDLFFEVSWVCAVPNDATYLRVLGERGYAEIETLFGLSPAGDRPAHPLRLWIDGQLVLPPVQGAASTRQPYEHLWDYFIDGIRDARDFTPWLDDAVETVRLIDHFYQAAGRV
jgi:predicted dehydrogenase